MSNPGAGSILQSSPRGCPAVKAIIEPPVHPSVPRVKVCLAWGLGHSEANRGHLRQSSAGQQDRRNNREQSLHCQVNITIVFAPWGFEEKVERDMQGLAQRGVHGEHP